MASPNMLLLDSTNFNASDSNESLSDERDSFVGNDQEQDGDREELKAKAKQNALSRLTPAHLNH